MTVANPYCTVAELKAWLQISDSTDDTVLDTITGAVSRWIDGHTGQRFWVDAAVTTRTYEATSRYQLKIDPVSSASGFVVKTDSAGDGTFETTWLATDWELWPPNPLEEPELWTYSEVRAVGVQTFPLAYSGLLARRDRVQITAKFGYAAVPDAVKQACLIQSARLFKRRYSPEGVAGFNEMGVVRVVPVDHDVLALLQKYRLGDEVVVFA